MIYIPVLGALSNATGTLLEKLALKHRDISIKHFLVFVFLSSLLIMAPFIFFFADFTSEAFKMHNLIILAIIITLAILANLLSFFALRWEKLTNIQPLKLLEPLFVVLLAFAFFKSERDVRVLIPALIAGVALVSSHIKKHHLDFNKYILAGILSSLFYALEMVLSNVILPYYSPLGLYFSRAAGVFIFSALLFRPNFIKELGRKDKLILLAIGLAWVIYRLIAYYGYLSYGVIFTTLVLMLSPVFVYIYAHFILKEKMNWKNILTTIIIVACVTYVTLF